HQRNEELDELLLTQTWYRGSLNEALNGQLPSIVFNPEKGLSVSGTVLIKGTPLAGAKVNLFAPDAGVLLDTVTNSSGKFLFNRLMFTDRTELVVQATRGKGKQDVDILLDPEPEYFAAAEEAAGHQLNKAKDNTESNPESTVQSGRVLAEVVVKAVKDP